MKLYSIGDIHGCYDQLILLWKKIEEDAAGENFKVVFIGDYIDRGPKSFEVVEFLNDLKNSNDNNEYVFLKGNHEDMLMNDYRNFMNNGGEATLKSYKTNGFDNCDVHKDFYYNLENSHLHKAYYFVHAGIDPNFDLDNQLLTDKIWARRFNTYDGKYPENVFVVHGHTPVEEVVELKHQLNIDTACVFGVLDASLRDKGIGKLTAVRLPLNPKDEFKYFQVLSNEGNEL